MSELAEISSDSTPSPRPKGIHLARLDKRTIYFILLCVIFLLTYRVMLVSMFNIQELVAEALFLIVIFGYIAFRVFKRVYEKNYRLNRLEVLMAFFFFLPLIPALSSFREWGQPITYGIGTLREFYLLFGGLITYNLLREKKVDMKMVEQAIVTVAWLSIIFFYGMSLLTNPMDFKETGFAAAHEAKGGEAYYQFQTGFMFFGSIYYTVKGFLERRYHLLIYAAIFIIYIFVFRLDRTTMAVTGIAIFAFILLSLPIKTQIMNFFRFGVPIALLAGLVILVKPDITEDYVMMFSEVLDAASNVDSDDTEDNIRLSELEIAYKYIAKNPLFGSGKVSRQWVYGGYTHFLGYFFISDIGVVGQIFMYGFVGAGILYSQFFFSLFHSLKIRVLKNEPFLVAMKYCLLAIFFDSLTNGYLTIFAAQAFTLTILIYRFYEMDRIAIAELNENSTANKILTA